MNVKTRFPSFYDELSKTLRTSKTIEEEEELTSRLGILSAHFMKRLRPVKG